MICKQGKEVRILDSKAGYYIGTLNHGAPYCRCSEYFRTFTEANRAFDNGWKMRDSMEVHACNGGAGCV